MVSMSLTSFALGWFCRPSEKLPPVVRSAPSMAAPAATVPAFESHSDAVRTFDDAVTAPDTDYQRRLHLAAAVASLDRAEVVAALEREHARDPVEYSDRVLPTEALLARFAELDPAGAVAWLVQTFPRAKIEEAWRDVTLSAWIAQDRQAAVAWVNGLPPGPLRDEFTFALLGKLASVDLALAIQQCAGVRGGFGYNFSSVFATLAAKDLGTAREQALQLPRANASGAVTGVMQFWAARQPAEAYTWAAQLPPGELREGAIREIYSVWADKSPAEAAAFLTAHDGMILHEVAGNLAATWAQKDLAAARAWSEGLPASVRAQAQGSVINVWAESDPRGATEYVAARSAADQTDWLPGIVQSWAGTDRTAALAWAENSAPAAVRGEALQSVCNNWLQEDPRACLEYVLGHPAEKELREQTFSSSAGWAAQDPDGMWQWCQGVSDPKARGDLEAHALEGLATMDPVRASGMLGQLPPENQTEAASTVAQQWAQTDPAAAARWATALPVGEAQKGASSSVTTTWASFDAPGAAAWVDAQPAGESRDESISALVSNLPMHLDPAVAVRLARSVQNPDTRSTVLTQMATAWLGQDRPAATAWITQSPDFTPDVRQELLTPPAPVDTAPGATDGD